MTEIVVQTTSRLYVAFRLANHESHQMLEGELFQHEA